MVPILLIGAGGFAGAIARYLVDLRISSWTGGVLPWGTLVVNVSGSFLLGLLFALVVERDAMSAEVRGPLMIGFVARTPPFRRWHSRAGGCLRMVPGCTRRPIWRVPLSLASSRWSSAWRLEGRSDANVRDGSTGPRIPR